jgi:nucleoside-diphosphate-sugar epimerase
VKVLFIGGTGLISSASTQLAVERGIELYVLNRGQRAAVPPGATSIVADISDRAATAQALQGHRWDCVVNWVAFTADDVARDIELFGGSTRQYILISSASAYQSRPPAT